MQLQENEFISKGGNPDWLKGIDYLPQRLLNILPLNTLLCHQPWNVSEKHFQVSNSYSLLSFFIDGV